jgi:hypothetical protein
MEYIVCPSKKKDCDEEPMLYNTTKREIIQRHVDAKKHKKKGSEEGHRELVEAIKAGVPMEELMEMNAYTIGKIKTHGMNGCRAWIQEIIDFHMKPRDGKEGIPRYETWWEHAYKDCYNYEKLKSRIKEMISDMKFKDKHPYMYGGPDTFKTTSVYKLCCELGLRLFEAPASMREWKDFDINKYDIIMWDEMSVDRYKNNMSRMKTFLQGSKTSLDIKFGTPMTVSLRKAENGLKNIPIIFCANEEGEPWMYDQAFQARIERYDCDYSKLDP